jgi:hypothetical protein
MVQGSNENFRESNRSASRDDALSINRFDDNDGDSHGDDRASDVIKAEIDRTRAEMDYTVDELQRRLDPQAIVHNLLETARGSAGDVTRKALDIVRANPIPAALIGAGVIWMIVSMSRQAKSRSGHQQPRSKIGEQSPIQSSQRHGRDVGGPADVAYTEIYTESHRVSMGALREDDLHDELGGCGCGESFGTTRASHQESSSTGITQKLKDKTRGIGSQAMHRMQDMRGYVGHQLQHSTSRAKDWFEQTIDEYPLAVGAAFFTMGLIAGFAIPATTPENRYLGKHRDRLFNQAQEFGSELIDKGQQAAEKVVQQVKESVTASSSGQSDEQRNI